MNNIIFFFGLFIINNCWAKNYLKKRDYSTITLAKQKVKIDPSYFTLKYPNGVMPN
jgi:hypothetical protein